MSPALMNLAGLVVETLLYGIYLVLFTSTYLLVGRYKSSRASWKYVPLLRSMVFLSGFCLFAAVSGTWIVTVCRIFIGCVIDGSGAMWFSDDSQVTETLQNAFTPLSILIGDSMIMGSDQIISSITGLTPGLVDHRYTASG
ncbi:hypothetical protein C8J57DRAFT_1736245 [Mycena rebaudengoi]|nr:hypothetical protein C8J57DRAFT_1736245 [Mycena rebaudengoi]